MKTTEIEQAGLNSYLLNSFSGNNSWVWTVEIHLLFTRSYISASIRIH